MRFEWQLSATVILRHQSSVYGSPEGTKMSTHFHKGQYNLHKCVNSVSGSTHTSAALGQPIQVQL